LKREKFPEIAKCKGMGRGVGGELRVGSCKLRARLDGC
jgi:hypothetical protein